MPEGVVFSEGEFPSWRVVFFGGGELGEVFEGCVEDEEGVCFVVEEVV